MIRHIVMWSLRRPEDAPQFKALLESCRNVVPGVLEFTVGLKAEGHESTQDVVLVATFADRRVLDAYQNHPHHRAVSRVLGEMRMTREVLDFPIEDASAAEPPPEDAAFAPTVFQARL